MTPDPIMAHLEAAFAREIKRGAIPFTPTTGKRASPLGASVLPLRGPVVGTFPRSAPAGLPCRTTLTPGGRASSTNKDNA
jgi:hypothetical protein